MAPWLNLKRVTEALTSCHDKAIVVIGSNPKTLPTHAAIGPPEVNTATWLPRSLSATIDAKPLAACQQKVFQEGKPAIVSCPEAHLRITRPKTV